ncbi:MAG: hypothetical protein PVJ39_16290 [Gammaproteobacteria bacterium]
MNKIANHTVKIFIYVSLFALVVPITANATVTKEITVQGKPVAKESGTCTDTTAVDAVIRNMHQAKNALLSKSSLKAKKDLQQAYNELQDMRKSAPGEATERIAITHGPQLHDPGYFDTANAYYSSDMQDMRLLRMAKSDLQSGNSTAACSKLSAVRFPYVSANVQLPITKAESDANQALAAINLNNYGKAMDDINRLPLTASTYASIVHE